MIQFNLLPDVKIEFIKTRQRKRLIIFVSIVSSAVMLSIFILLFLLVRVNQATHIKNLDTDMKKNLSTIQGIEDIDKILTIQNQLNSLPGLHDQKVVTSRLPDYLTQLTPNEATISDVNMDFTANTMRIKGTSNKLETVNKFADTLKFTDYKVNKEDGASGKAFKDVVLQNFSVNTNPQGITSASYELVLAFDPAIFAVANDAAKDKPVTLNVPSITSTRSQTEKPSNLFAPQPVTETERR